MKRRTPLNLEPLEGKALLSGLSYSVTTNQSVYQPGQPIVMTFQETNVSDHEIPVEDGPSIDGFDVLQGGRPIWRSNSGVNPMFIRLDPLEPGQSLTLTATWDGVPTGETAPATGTFVIMNELAPQATATLSISGSASPPPTAPSSSPQPIVVATSPDPTSSAPSSVPSTASPDPSTIAVTIASRHPTHQNGHRVRMTLILQDIGNDPVALPRGAARRFTLFEGTTPIWRQVRIVSRGGSHTLDPGQSVRATAVWNGNAQDAGIPLVAGTVTLQANG